MRDSNYKSMLQQFAGDRRQTRLPVRSLIPVLCMLAIAAGIIRSTASVADATSAAPIKDDPLIKVSISGIWESNVGWKYDIKQKGAQFTWTVINRDQVGTGTIDKNNRDLQVNWSEKGSKGTAKGLIVELTEQGKATFIEWDNGVFFHREK